MFSSIFLKLFLNNTVNLKKDHETVQVQFLSYDGGIATLKIPPGHDPLGAVVIYLERASDVVYSNMTYIAAIGHDKYTFDALDLQVMEYVKPEEPKPVVEEVRNKQRSGQIYLSDVISDFSLIECLKNNTRRVEYMRDEILKKLSAVYPHSIISFIHDKKPNYRMDFFREVRQPYFYPEFRRPSNPSENRELASFMTNIYDHDYTIVQNHYESEICVPILYKLMMPFGYIQVNSQSPLTEKDYSAIRKLGMSASVIFTNDQRIIRSAGDILAINDMSKNGFGIVFREKPLIKHFRENSMVSFNIYLPENKKASVLAAIRHITLVDNKMYKVGVEIINIDSIGELYYGDYIDMVQGKRFL